MIKIVYIFFVFFFFCCGFIAKKGYGVKKQRTESQESVKIWLGDHGFNADDVYSVAPQDYYNFIPGLSQAPLLFDTHTGNFLAIGFSNGKYCPLEIDRSFSSILPYNLIMKKPDSFLISRKIVIPKGVSIKDAHKYPEESDTLLLSIDYIRGALKTLAGETISDKLFDKENYLLVIPYALFLGNKLQVKDLKKVYFSAQANQFSKIKIIFLNLDKQEWWGDEWNNKISIN